MERLTFNEALALAAEASGWTAPTLQANTWTCETTHRGLRLTLQRILGAETFRIRALLHEPPRGEIELARFEEHGGGGPLGELYRRLEEQRLEAARVAEQNRKEAERLENLRLARLETERVDTATGRWRAGLVETPSTAETPSPSVPHQSSSNLIAILVVAGVIAILILMIGWALAHR